MLWKKSKAGEPSWNAPWSAGRPGWHLECSVMATELLGDTFDIHGGGFDLIFPHHENECAQSEAVTGKNFVNTWMHAGFLQINDEKMSKSLGNFTTINEALELVHPEVLRIFMISCHYRSQLEYSTKRLISSAESLTRLYLSLRDLDLQNTIKNTELEKNIEIKKIYDNYQNLFMQAMNDDFNTPEALAVLFELAREVNKLKDNKSNSDNLIFANYLGLLLKKLANILGLLLIDAEEFLQQKIIKITIEDPENIDDNVEKNDIREISDQEIKDLIVQRDNARLDKNWQLADEIRDRLQNMGIVLEDSATGTKWRR